MTLNCLIVDDDAFARDAVRLMIEKTEDMQVVASLDNAIEALKILKEQPIDLLFLDIEMPEMSGLEMVESLENAPQVVLITSNPEYAVQAFELSITDYLVKPIKYVRFLKSVEKVRSNLTSPILDSLNKEDIYVKSDSKIVKIKLDDIQFVEALSDYVIINTAEKRYIVHSTMKSIEQKLSQNNFTRVHRSYIVNIDKIQTIEDLNIIMPKKSIPIGASYKNAFLSKLNFL